MIALLKCAKIGGIFCVLNCISFCFVVGVLFFFIVRAAQAVGEDGLFGRALSDLE